MSPDSSPSKSGQGVKIVNNNPLLIGGAVLLAFAVVIAMVASSRSQMQNQPQKIEDKKVGNTKNFAEQITLNEPNGFIPELIEPEKEAEPVPEAIEIVRPALDEPPAPIQYEAVNVTPQIDEEAQRIRMAKLHMLESAAKGRTGINYSAPRSAPSRPSAFTTATPKTRAEMLSELNRVRQAMNNNSVDPTAAYKARLEQVKSLGISGNVNSAPNQQPIGFGSPINATDIKPTAYSGFNKSKWKNKSTITTPEQYEIRAGFVIPSTLISGINSDIPGTIIGQVAQNVFDTATGKYLLIPQGSKLYGEYSSNVLFGQKRLLVAWQRIVFPDGKALDIGAMQGADGVGYAGFKDKVNNHYLRIFGSAILMSGITASITLSQPEDESSSDKERVNDAFSEALGEQLGQVTIEMIRKNMNISPTLTIRPGFRFNVIVTKDLVFSKPYQSFDY